VIETWHNLSRRKLRTTLTVLGITVGTLALTVMGAMSEKINLLVDGALQYYGTRVVVQAAATLPGQFLGPVLSASIAEDIRGLPNVAAAFPTVYTLYQEDPDDLPSASFGFPPLVIGVDARRFDYEEGRYPIALSAGRLFGPGERGVAIVGVDLAKYKGAKLGGMLTVRGRDLLVVGIMERTLTARDNLAFVALADGQDFLAQLLPPAFSADPSALATEIEVYPERLDQADGVAEDINRQIPGVRALSPTEVKRQFAQSLIIFNVIIISSAVIAMVVGGLSILNTMAVAVSERTREIGIKKAVGATNLDIMKEFLREAVIIGFVGGLLGLGAGAVLAWLINTVVAGQGVVIMAVTLRLSVFVVVFTTALGAFAGLYPALAAARRSPVEALRAE
jgi:putative ABC transport system permease protein